MHTVIFPKQYTFSKYPPSVFAIKYIIISFFLIGNKITKKKAEISRQLKLYIIYNNHTRNNHVYLLQHYVF